MAGPFAFQKDVGLYIPRVGPFASLGKTAVSILPNRLVVGPEAVFNDQGEGGPMVANLFHIQGGATLFTSNVAGCCTPPVGGIWINCHEFRISQDSDCTPGIISAEGAAGGVGAIPCSCTLTGGEGGNGASGGGGGGYNTGGFCSSASGGAGGSATGGSAGTVVGCGAVGGAGGQGFGSAYAYAYGNGGDTGGCGNPFAPGGNGYGGGGYGGDVPNGCDPGAGGGGGGGGGIIAVVANKFTSDSVPTITTLGGSGGGGVGIGNAGGTGGSGVVWMAFRQKIFGSPIIGATSARLYEIRQDNSLILRNWADTWNNL